jgi:hypothetical protein
MTLRGSCERRREFCIQVPGSCTSLSIPASSGLTRGPATLKPLLRCTLGIASGDGYRDAPGISPDGLRAKVGAVHLTLADLAQAFLDADFQLTRVEEVGDWQYPPIIALQARR